MSPMSPRLAKRVAWSLCALAVALGLGLLPLVVAVTRAAPTPGTPLPPDTAERLQVSALDWVEGVFGVVALVAFSVLGAVIVARSPARTLGWIFCVMGFLGAVEPFAAYYALVSLFVVSGALPGALIAGWLQHWTWVVSAALLSAFLPLLFPHGRLVSARWKPAWWLAATAMLALALGAAFHPDPLWNYLDRFDVPNPFGVTSLDGVMLVLSSLPFGLLLASMLVAAASPVVWLRCARGDELRQLKWFAYCGALLAGLFVMQGIVRHLLGASTPAFEFAFRLAWPVALTGLPVATGLAILRYRLFDVDILIRLTLVYGTLSALLAGAYVGLVLAAQAAVRALTGQTGQPQQPPVIVASTLLVVALAMPLRRGIQTTIDRRFYRRTYDAERTLAAFSAKLRNEVDLEQVRKLLIAVVEETLQPAHAALWLRQPERPPTELASSLEPREQAPTRPARPGGG
jgi:hypothetical protein